MTKLAETIKVGAARFHAGVETATAQGAIDRLHARYQKFEKALRDLAVLGEQGMKPDYKEWLTFHDKVSQVARAALNLSDDT